MKKQNNPPKEESAFDKMHPKNPLLAEMPFPQSEYGKIDLGTQEMNVPERIYVEINDVYSEHEARPNLKIRTPFNYHPYLGKHNRQPSLTVPNQSMSVDEILRRHTLGLPMIGQKVELWEGDEDIMPDLKGLDLAEIQELKEQAVAKINDIRNRYAKEQTKSERKKLLDELKAEIDKAQKDAESKDKDKKTSDK